LKAVLRGRVRVIGWASDVMAQMTRAFCFQNK
jgi:hypothetical protein